ncbi:MAG: hypothetical protein NVS3B26_17990 [Mycobacteriales bacterium]
MAAVFDNRTTRERREYGVAVGRTHNDLLCAACSGRVVDGGCPTCRLTRQQLPAAERLPAEALLTLAALLAVFLVLASHF